MSFVSAALARISSTARVGGRTGGRKSGRNSERKGGGGAGASEAPGDLLTEEEEDLETCEIVQGSNVILGEEEDAFQGYLIQAIKNNNGVAVLFLTDVLGFEDGESRDFAYRLACFGYK